LYVGFPCKPGKCAVRYGHEQVPHQLETTGCFRRIYRSFLPVDGFQQSNK